MKALTILALLGSFLPALPVSAQDMRTEHVHFEPCASGATVKGRIKRSEAVHYVLGARKGQSMVVVLNTDNNASYFNVFSPGKKPGQDEAMFIGSTEGTRYEGDLPADGDYLVQIYLMRSAARRDEVANYTLEVGISGSAE